MRRRSAAGLGFLVALIALAGCAGPTLDIGYPDTAANRALLASVAPRQVVVPTVTDRRADTSRIGSTPEDRKPIVTSRPVPDIVRDALVVELRTNGHQVVAGAGDAVVLAEVEEFWLDRVGDSDDTRYVGRVAIRVIIANGSSGDRLFTRGYVGIARRIADAGSKETWREAMDSALARAMHDLATDPAAVAAVRGTLP